MAIGSAQFPVHLGVALAVAIPALWLTPALLPTHGAALPARMPALQALPQRMLAGAALTVGVTAAAGAVGAAWSGILAVFPVMGVVLSVFTHREEGAAQVVQIFLGMIRGLYSFLLFFVVLAVLLPRTEVSSACAAAALASVLVQVAAQQWGRTHSLR